MVCGLWFESLECKAHYKFIVYGLWFVVKDSVNVKFTFGFEVKKNVIVIINAFE